MSRQEVVPCLQAGLLGLWRCSWYWLKLQEAGEWARGRSAGRQEQSRGSLSLSELKLIYTHRALKSLGKQQAEEPFLGGGGRSARVLGGFTADICRLRKMETD